jgi:1,4-dihydroxy-2-naphthoate octaprenyltransferase
MLFVACLVGALVAIVLCALFEPLALIALIATPLAYVPARNVRTREDPPSLIAALVGTVRFELAIAVLLAIGLWAS